MTKTRVAILGGTGYTALELIRLLLRHPYAEIVAVTSRQESGTRVSDSHPSLIGRCDLPFTPFDAATLQAAGVHCAFACLPHGASMAAVPELLARGIRVVDLSADYRLHDPNVYAAWYKEPHTDLENLKHAVYGLPELHAERIRSARLVANPGCYPQTAILGLAPLVRGHLIERHSIIIDSKSGVSGAGRSPKLSTHFPECNESLSAYSLGHHRHTPEIEQELSQVAAAKVQVIFTPHLIPMDRGIFSTIYATPRTQIDDSELVRLYEEYYQGQPFVRVRQSLPTTKDSAHTNFLDLCPKIVRDRIIILASEDNLIRGASGVAVQNFNIMFDFDPAAGLA